MPLFIWFRGLGDPLQGGEGKRKSLHICWVESRPYYEDAVKLLFSLKKNYSVKTILKIQNGNKTYITFIQRAVNCLSISLEVKGRELLLQEEALIYIFWFFPGDTNLGSYGESPFLLYALGFISKVLLHKRGRISNWWKMPRRSSGPTSVQDQQSKMLLQHPWQMAVHQPLLKYHKQRKSPPLPKAAWFTVKEFLALRSIYFCNVFIFKGRKQVIL